MRRSVQGAHRDNRGSNVIETALAMLIVTPMLICLFEICMFCYTMATLQYASRQGVQYAMTHGTNAPNCSGPGGSVHSSCPDVVGANVTAVVMAVAGSSGHTLSSGQIQLIWANNTNNPGNPVTVRVQYPYKTYSHVPFPALTINGTATGQIVY
jgi:Flp pilus assembly protein TadG